MGEDFYECETEYYVEEEQPSGAEEAYYDDEASSDQFCHCQGCLGKYTLLRDEENPQLAKFERRLPCFGCGIGWSSFILGFLCPLIWYCATTLYCCKYYNRDPRERPGLAASAVAAVIFTTVTIITVSIILICAYK